MIDPVTTAKTIDLKPNTSNAIDFYQNNGGGIPIIANHMTGTPLSTTDSTHQNMDLTTAGSTHNSIVHDVAAVVVARVNGEK
jgi:hypothetical protein